MTPQDHVILAALIRKAAELELDLSLSGKPTALQMVLVKTRDDAIEACGKLIDCPHGDAALVQSLQNDVRVFLDLVAAAQTIMVEATDAENELSLEDREAVHDLIMPPSAPHSSEPEE